MSIVGSALRSIRSLLFPSACIVCGEHVSEHMRGVCIRCRSDIPLTYFWREEDNPVKDKISNFVPIVHGSSFIFFSGDSLWRDMVHRFKYSGEWAAAKIMGEWYGSELRASDLYNDVDVVVPVPLHPLKTMRRGYNQSRYIAEAIARELGVDCVGNAVVRRRNNPPQARRSGAERWDNVEGLFAVRRPKKLRGRHILVVDDVLTTGATLSACVSAIMRAMPDARISVATLAVTRRIVRE